MNYEEKIASYKEEIIEKVAIWSQIANMGSKAISSGIGKKVISSSLGTKTLAGAGIGAAGSNLTYDPNNAAGESRMSHMMGGAVTGGLFGAGTHVGLKAGAKFAKGKGVASVASKVSNTIPKTPVTTPKTTMGTPAQNASYKDYFSKGNSPDYETFKKNLVHPDRKAGPVNFPKPEVTKAESIGNPITGYNSDALQNAVKKNQTRTAEEYNELVEKLAAEIIEQAYIEKIANAQEQNLKTFANRVKTDKTTRPDSNYNEKQLDEGVKVEHEHTNDIPTAKTIAKDHLDEIRDYYTRLKKMESKAKK